MARMLPTHPRLRAFRRFEVRLCGVVLVLVLPVLVRLPLLVLVLVLLLVLLLLLLLVLLLLLGRRGSRWELRTLTCLKVGQTFILIYQS